MRRSGVWLGAVVALLLLVTPAGADPTPQTDIMGVEATSAAGAAVSFPQADQNGDSCTPASGSSFGLGTTTVSCNAMSYEFTVTVVDSTPPAIVVPAPIVAEATGAAGTAVSFNVSASDLVDGPVAASCDHASGSVFAFGTTTVTCNATDAHGNGSQNAFTVNVVDSTPPAIAVPASIVAEATGAAGAAVSFNVSASDLVDGPVAASCDHASGSVFALGTTTVTCNATDAHANGSQNAFTVNVVDSTPPVVVVPAPIVAEATGAAGAAVTFNVSASDLVDGAVAVACDHASGSVFALGTTTVTCNATDAHGNHGQNTLTVKVVDKTPPTITVPAPIVTQAATSSGAVVAYGVTAVDLVDGPVAVTCLPASGSLFSVGVTTVTCNAVDSKGNAAAPKTFKITVTALPAAPAPPAPTPTPTPTVPTAPFQPPAQQKPPAVSGFAAAAGNRRVILRWKLPAGDGLHVELARALGAGSPTTIYTGAGVSFTDTHVQNGSRYLYSIVVVDPGGNRSDGVTQAAAPNALKLVTPAPGASIAAPPTLLWVPVAGASYYNVQLFRDGTKVLSIWPGSNHLKLKRHWVFGGRSQTLVAGSYTWFVWPGFGPHKAKKYGNVLGSSSFHLTG